MFVSRQGTALATFRIAIEKADADKAMQAVGEMEIVSARDSLELCRLLAVKDDPRFDRAATRWLEVLSRSAGVGLPDLQLASSAMAVLAIDPDSEQAWGVLTGLISA